MDTYSLIAIGYLITGVIILTVLLAWDYDKIFKDEPINYESRVIALFLIYCIYPIIWLPYSLIWMLFKSVRYIRKTFFPINS